MTDTWKVQDAKARFSELLDACTARGPQIITRRGVETAVFVSIEQWRSLQTRVRPNIKEWLLAPGARSETLVPRRKKHQRRESSKF